MTGTSDTNQFTRSAPTAIDANLITSHHIAYLPGVQGNAHYRPAIDGNLLLQTARKKAKEAKLSQRLEQNKLFSDCTQRAQRKRKQRDLR